jgi:integrase
MGSRKIKTQYPGVRYYEHPSRKRRDGQPDRYFSIRYRREGRLVEEGLGWAGEGWNAEKAHVVLARIKAAARTGEGPVSLAEMRAESEARRRAESQAAKRESLTAISLAVFFTDFYLPRAKRDKSSWPTDVQRFHKMIEPALGLRPLRDIGRTDVQRLLDDLAASGAAASTIAQYLAIIRRIYNIAAETMVEGAPLFAGLNPAKGVRRPVVRNNRERYLTGPEAEKLIAEAAKLKYPDLHDAIVLSLNTGLRLGELRRLTWMDVDFPGGMITVREEARRKPGGKVPINAAAETVLRSRQAGAQKTELVFPPIFGPGLRSQLSQRFHQLADRLGFNDGLAPDDRQRRVVFHTLRHTFASWLALAGVDIYRIKTLMRHKTLAMTMRYAHLIPDATREAVHRLSPPTDY